MQFYFSCIRKISKNFSHSLSTSFLFSPEGTKIPKSRKRVLSVLFSVWKKEKLRSRREMGFLAFISPSSFWCCQLHSAHVIARVLQKRLHHATLNPELMTLIKKSTRCSMILNPVPDSFPRFSSPWDSGLFCWQGDQEYKAYPAEQELIFSTSAH